MSTLSQQMDALRVVLQNASPYRHIERRPWNLPYRYVSFSKGKRISRETGLRMFSIECEDERPFGMGTDGNLRFEVEILLCVYYPFRHDIARAEEYFSEETRLVRRLFESPDSYVSGTRMIAHDHSYMESVGEEGMLFNHRYGLLVDETLN